MATEKSKVTKGKSTKKVTKKAKITKKAAPKKAKPKTTKTSVVSKTKKSITPEERVEMIRIAAYYLAEKRGYQGNDELADWFRAEKEVDALDSSDF